MSMSRPRFAAGFVLFESTPIGRRYLLLRNTRHGTWGFPKGHRDGSETDLDCAFRELAEETGLRDIWVDADFRVVVRYVVHERTASFEKTTTYFLARVNRGEIHLSSEHSQFAWTDAESARDLLGFDSLRDLITRAELHLGDESS